MLIDLDGPRTRHTVSVADGPAVTVAEGCLERVVGNSNVGYSNVGNDVSKAVASGEAFTTKACVENDGPNIGPSFVVSLVGKKIGHQRLPRRRAELSTHSPQSARFPIASRPRMDSCESTRRPSIGGIMQVVITSRNVEMTTALRELTTEKVTRVTKYLPGMEKAEVRFSEERNKRISNNEVCEVTLHGHGHHVRAKASAPDSQAAVDLVIDKLAHQLTKLKDKLVTLHHDRHHHYGRRADRNKGGVALLEPDLDTFSPPPTVEPFDEAMIVKSKQFVMNPITAEEACLKMDLLQHDFFLFTNAETGRAAVVYRREDGHLGLIDAA
jgi:putative sigma-54 modulation protein